MASRPSPSDMSVLMPSLPNSPSNKGFMVKSRTLVNIALTRFNALSSPYLAATAELCPGAIASRIVFISYGSS